MKLYQKNYYFTVSCHSTGADLKAQISAQHVLNSDDYYITSNGKIVKDNQILYNERVHIIPRILGGKGGFGSMLRAIGAQIEKTTNRDACRDLSGRRLRDINEEQRLKNWINQQAEREKEAAERKRKKLERMCEQPKHEFKDEEYDKERSVLPEMVEDAVLQGLQASSSSKRKAVDEKPVVKKKKPKLWVDDEIGDSDDDFSDNSEDNDEVVENKNVDDCSRNKQEIILNNLEESSSIKQKNTDSSKGTAKK